MNNPAARMADDMMTDVAGVLPARMEVHADPRAIEAEWRAFEACAAGDVFAGYDFISLWAALVAPGRGVTPRVVVGRTARGAICTILPFGLRRNLGLRVLEWLGGEQADFPGGLYLPELLAALSADAGAMEAFKRQALAAAGPADILRFERQMTQVGGYARPLLGCRPFRGPNDRHATRLGGDWDTYYTTKRAPGSRKNDRKKRAALERIGPVRFVIAQTPEEQRPILDALMGLKRASLARQGIGDMFGEPGVEAFYRALATRIWPAGPAHVSALYCGDRIAAANWGLVRGDHFYYVLHAYDSGELSRQSPGRLLMYELMRWSIDNRISLFDFTVGDEGFKDDWCELSEPLYEVIAPLSPLAGPIVALHRSANAAKRKIKTTPALWDRYQSARRQLGRLRGGGGEAPSPSED